MKSVKSLYMILGTLIIILIFLVWKQSESQAGKINEQTMTNRENCKKWEVIAEEILQMKTYGYPQDIPLEEGIRLFNEEEQCRRHWENVPPLTENEFVAAIVAGAERGKQGPIWLAQKDALWKIIKSKQLPKGALLVADYGSREMDTFLNPEGVVVAEGLTISLLLNLNDTPDGILKSRTPEQAFLIRKMYYKVRYYKKGEF